MKSKWVKSIFVFTIGTALLIFAYSANAGPSLSISARQDIYTNEHIDSGTGLTGKLAWDSGFYLWVGKSDPRIKWAGQPVAKVDILSGGIGFQYIVDRFKRVHPTIYVQAGYYDPSVEDQGGKHHEGLIYFVRDQLPGSCDTHWNNWIYDIDPGFGGEIGLSLDYDVTSWISLGITAAYRMLELQRIVIRSPEPYHDYDQTHHEFYDNVNFGGPSVGANLTIRF